MDAEGDADDTEAGEGVAKLPDEAATWPLFDPEPELPMGLQRQASIAARLQREVEQRKLVVGQKRAAERLLQRAQRRHAEMKGAWERQRRQWRQRVVEGSRGQRARKLSHLDNLLTQIHCVL